MRFEEQISSVCGREITEPNQTPRSRKRKYPAHKEATKPNPMPRSQQGTYPSHSSAVKPVGKNMLDMLA
jgi:hypothetical protein